MTAEIINKSAQELMKYIDEDLLERIKCGFGRGIFKTSVYYMADNPSNANRLKVGICRVSGEIVILQPPSGLSFRYEAPWSAAIAEVVSKMSTLTVK